MSWRDIVCLIFFAGKLIEMAISPDSLFVELKANIARFIDGMTKAAFFTG